jgi:hypothetical protein
LRGICVRWHLDANRNLVAEVQRVLAADRREHRAEAELAAA